MDFRESTQGVPAAVLARAFGVSAQTIRQYRLDPDSSGHRSPPADWRRVVTGVLADLGDDLRARIAVLRDDGQP